MQKLFTASAAALAIATIAVPAQAATIVVDYALDPALIGPAISQAALPTPFTAGVGDTVEYHLTFTTPTVTLSGDNQLWLLSLTNSGSTVLTVSSVWKFLSPSANLLPTVIVPTEIAQNVHVGSYLDKSQYRLDAAPITFSGIDLTINILDAMGYDTDGDGTIDQPAIDPRSYNTIALYTTGSAVGAPSAVPEPATWAMMIVGVGIIGAAARRRQQVRVTYA